MQQVRALWCIIIIVSMLSTISVGDCLAEENRLTVQKLKALLGDRMKEGKLVAKKEGKIVTVDLSSLRVTVIGEFGPDSKFWGLSTPNWSPDGSRILCSYRGQAFVLKTDGSPPEKILKGTKLHSPFWWKDPKSGEICIVYKNADAKHWYKKGKSPGATYLWRPSTGRAHKILDFPCDGTMSADGTHIGEAYGGCLIADIPNQKYHVLYRGRQSCNSSMSPDNTYRIMHLYLPHTHFGIRDKNDRELWKISNPVGTLEWQVPNWSTDPDFCTATAKVGEREYKLAIIRIHDSQVVVLKGLGGNWKRSHLWLN
ncbi:TolB-like translocation protein [Desulfogranum japonicum]|uniref:hypothetical protein n=1 Tax=Desulfogranum japonicum TaxID=231447 RepID=UPI00041718E0|nr:hypothetical protein [Desulfogranum japonicum]